MAEMISKPLKYRLLSFLLVLCSVSAVMAQQPGTDQSKTSQDGIVDIYNNARSENDQIPVFGNDSIAKLLAAIQGKSFRLEEIKSILVNRLDTSDMRKNIPQYLEMVKLFQANTRNRSGKLSMRYLQGMEVVVNTMLENTDAYAEALSKNIDRLTEVEKGLEAIKPDSLNKLPADSFLANTALKREMLGFDSTLDRIEKNYKEQRSILFKYQTALGGLRLKLKELSNIVEEQKMQVIGTYWAKEINYPWEKITYETGTWRQKINDSNALNLKITSAYIGRTIKKSLWLLVLIAGVYLLFRYFVRNMLGKIHQGELVLSRLRYFNKQPLFASLVLSLPFAYLFYTNMPVPFVAILTFLFILCCFPFLLAYQPPKIFRILIVSMVAYLFYSHNRLLWETVYELRWIHLVFAAWALIMGMYIWVAAGKKNAGYDQEGSRLLRWLSAFLVFMSSVALLANLLGRYNVAKVFGNTGVVSFYRGIGYYFFVQVAMEAIYILFEASKPRRENATSNINYQELHKKLKYVLSIFAIISWVYFLLFYLGVIDQVRDSFLQFLQAKRRVGDVNFTFGDISLFVGILLLSGFLANMVAYYSTLRDQRASLSRKNRLGSSILLIRLAILTIGFLLALAATRIPIDRITIVLGALSVGIGFGLQNIIENLVSGVILAFEQPVQIGDKVEIGGTKGVVQEIGIRSSRIRSPEGSDVVIPNSELISREVVNWTLTDNLKQVELILGVTYDSDIFKAKVVIEDILERTDLLQDPQPEAIFNVFGKNALEFKISFWVENHGSADRKKSEIIGAIVAAFKEHGIKLPEKL